MKILYLFILLLIFNSNVYAQKWAKKGTVFYYDGSVVELFSQNTNSEVLKVVKNFKITIDSVLKIRNATFIFLTNNFDAIHAGIEDDSILSEPICLAVYQDTLYTVSFEQNTRLNKTININHLFKNKLPFIYADKQYSVLKFNSKRKSMRYSNELAPNAQEPEFSFKSMVKVNGYMPTTAASLVAEDGRGSYHTNIFYTDRFFIVKYICLMYRTSTPYKLELSLKKIVRGTVK